MQPFDDSIPEEREPSHAALVSMLRQASPGPVQLSAKEQAQVLERAWQRLQSPDKAGAESEEQAAGAVGSMPPKKTVTRPFAVRRGRRMIRFASTLAAVLVVAAIISASLLLFTHRSQRIGTLLPHSSPVGPVGKVSVFSEAGGLLASMEITGAPYFLSELLQVDLSLTNHSQTTYMLEGSTSVTFSVCDVPALWVDVVGGNAPYYTLPQRDYLPCQAPGFTQFKPGQTISLREYYALSASRNIKLTEKASFLSKGVDSHGNPVITAGKSPLDGHWPTIQLNVNSRVAPDRTLSFHMQGPRAFIDAPAEAQHSLLYEYTVSCQIAGGGGEIGAFTWQPVRGNQVSEPACSGNDVKWTFAFGAPGFAIVQGHYSA